MPPDPGDPAPEAPRLRVALDTEGRDPVVRLAGLAFMDSVGLRTIVNAHQRLRTAGGRLLLARGPAAIDRVFAVTGTDRHLHFLEG